MGKAGDPRSGSCDRRGTHDEFGSPRAHRARGDRGGCDRRRMAPFAIYGAATPVARARRDARPRRAVATALRRSLAALPLAIAGFDAEDRLLGASRRLPRRARRAQRRARRCAAGPASPRRPCSMPGRSAAAAPSRRVTAIATLPAHELIWPANGNPHAAIAWPASRCTTRRARTYRLLVDPAILSAAPLGLPAAGTSAADDARHHRAQRGAGLGAVVHHHRRRLVRRDRAGSHHPLCQSGVRAHHRLRDPGGDRPAAALPAGPRHAAGPGASGWSAP